MKPTFAEHGNAWLWFLWCPGLPYLDALSLDLLQLLLNQSQLLLLPMDVSLDQHCPLLQLLPEVLHGVYLSSKLHCWLQGERSKRKRGTRESVISSTWLSSVSFSFTWSMFLSLLSKQLQNLCIEIKLLIMQLFECFLMFYFSFFKCCNS